jgi:hypothetical protein
LREGERGRAWAPREKALTPNVDDTKFSKGAGVVPSNKVVKVLDDFLVANEKGGG